MSLRLTTKPTIEGLELRGPIIGGVTWVDGVLVGLAEGEVVWARGLDRAPRVAAAGRRVYLAADGIVACIDARTGTELWGVELPAPVAALAAHSDGVDVAAGDRIRGFAPDGTPTGEQGGVDASSALLTLPAARYAAGPGGVWRLDGRPRPTCLTTHACVGMYARDGRFQAIVDGGEGTLLLEDEGLPLLWPFPERGGHLVAPYDRAEWAVAPLRGPSGVWVVDRQVRTRWHVPLAGAVRALEVVGVAVLALVEDEGPVLALIHPDVSAPLLLAAPGADSLCVDRTHVLLAGGGATRVYQLREG